jgi:hypothetical protein
MLWHTNLNSPVAPMTLRLICQVTDRDHLCRPSVQFPLFARFALTKFVVSANRDVGAGNILDCLACLCEVVRVEMTGTRWPESRRFLARI